MTSAAASWELATASASVVNIEWVLEGERGAGSAEPRTRSKGRSAEKYVFAETALRQFNTQLWRAEVTGWITSDRRSTNNRAGLVERGPESCELSDALFDRGRFKVLQKASNMSAP
jgi:hypothetical protein